VTGPIVEEHYQGLATGRDSRFQVRFALRRADGEDVWVYLTLFDPGIDADDRAELRLAAAMSGAPGTASYT
jgi:hypothetical protein